MLLWTHMHKYLLKSQLSISFGKVCISTIYFYLPPSNFNNFWNITSLQKVCIECIHFILWSGYLAILSKWWQSFMDTQIFKCISLDSLQEHPISTGCFYRNTITYAYISILNFKIVLNCIWDVYINLNY